MRDAGLLSSFVPVLLVTLALTIARLFPTGEAALLVRLPEAGPPGGWQALPAVSLVALPAPGFAVLRGDAAAIRAAFGLSVPWHGAPPCRPPT